jgi:hypothetical protein
LLCELSNGVLASADGVDKVKFWNYIVTSNQLLSSYTGISSNGNNIRAMTEVNMQLYVSDDQKKLYIFNETTYALFATVTGFSDDIVAMSSSADGLHFAAALDSSANGKFSYFAAVTASGSASSPQAKSTQDDSNNMRTSMMDRWGAFFFTGDNKNGIWSWDVAMNGTGGLITTAKFYNSNSYSKMFITQFYYEENYLDILFCFIYV